MAHLDGVRLIKLLPAGQGSRLGRDGLMYWIQIWLKEITGQVWESSCYLKNLMQLGAAGH